MWHLFISPISFSNFLCLPHWKSYSVTCLLFLKETKLCDPSEYHCYYLGKIFITTSSPPQATTASWFLLNLQVSAIVAPHPRLGYIFWQYPRLCLYTYYFYIPLFLGFFLPIHVLPIFEGPMSTLPCSQVLLSTSVHVHLSLLWVSFILFHIPTQFMRAEYLQVNLWFYSIS